MSATGSFRVLVTKDYLKFSAAHFMAYPGFRERLHGHNYRLSIAAWGPLSREGYVVEFGIVKRIASKLCERLDGGLLLPARSDCLTILEDGDSVVARYENDEFRFPRGDVVLLPIAHTSVEELAEYLAGEIRTALAEEGVGGLDAIEIGIAESAGQTAYFRLG